VILRLIRASSDDIIIGQSYTSFPELAVFVRCGQFNRESSHLKGACIMSATIFCAMVCAGLAFQQADSDPPIAVDDVVGALELPYSGPGELVLAKDGWLELDVGGNIGAFAIHVRNADGEEVSVLGKMTLDFDPEKGMLYLLVDDGVQVVDRVYRVSRAPDSPEWLEQQSPDVDCPANKKCCTCTGANGGSASAVCNEDERPRCDCSPCCSATCLKIKTDVELAPAE